MRIITIATFVLLLIMACKKGIEHDKQYIRGRIFIQDTITSNKGIVSIDKKLKVLLSKAGDTLNYMYSTYTDSEGYFTFDLLSDDNTAYIVSATDTITSNNVKYFYHGKETVSRGDKEAKVILQLDQSAQNGFILYLKDPLNEKLPNVRLFVFNNSTLATSNDTASAIIKLWSNNNGQVFQFNLSAGDYFMNAEKISDTVMYQRIGKKITINQQGFVVDSMMLFKKAPKNGFVMMLRDSIGGMIPAAEVRIYSSLLLAAANTSTGSIATLVSDSVIGRISKLNLTAGIYYLNATKINGTDSFMRIAKVINVPVTGFINDTVVLRKRTANYNGFTLEARDSVHGIFPSVSFYVYNSIVLAEGNNVAGAIETITGDNYGKASLYNLPAGNYFVNAIRKFNDTLIYERMMKSLSIPGSGFVTDTIVLRKKNMGYTNGIVIQARDSLNGIFPGTIFYLYNSQVLAQFNTPAGSIATLTGDDFGKASKYNLPSGTYYINAIKKLSDSVIYERIVKPVLLPATGILSDTMVLKRKLM